jgi:predicted Zn-dependent peptidase
MEVLSDMVFNSNFPEEEFVKEREVVKEEEISSKDGVQSFIWRSFSKEFFDNYLANPVIGTQESISNFTSKEVADFHARYCNQSDAVVSLCSNLKRGEAKLLLKKHFGKASGRIKSPGKFSESNYKDSRVVRIKKQGIEHTYVWMGMPAPLMNGKRGGPAEVLNTIMGDGMDSRLFTEVRERHGLVYGISSSHNDFQGGAFTLINFSTREQNVDSAISIVEEQIKLIKRTPPSEEEVQRAKNKIKSGFYSAIEDSFSLAHWAVKQKLLGYPSIDEYMANIESVTPQMVMLAANEIYDDSRRLTVICNSE